MDLAEEKEASSLSYGDVVFRSSLGSKKMVIDGSRLSLDAHHEVRLLSISEAPRPSSMEGYPSNGVTRHPSRKSVLRGLSEALMRRSLTKIDLSQRGLGPADARLVKMALVQNAQVKVLKLGYNNIGDDGIRILVDKGIDSHPNLESLDLGFNNVGDEGCTALVGALPSDGRVWTLYLAGNLISEDGAMAIADMIQRCNVRKLYLTGNRLGPAGVKAIADAVVEDEASRASAMNGVTSCENFEDPAYEEKLANGSTCVGMQELFLGGTKLESAGCEAVARLVQRTRSLQVLSLSNCEIGDEEIMVLAAALRANRNGIPLTSLQLSFNRISSVGLEKLVTAIRGMPRLREVLLDNNEIGDTGVQLISSLIPTLPQLATLNIGFNKIKTAMKLLSKSIAESKVLESLSISGISIDATSAKYIAYALAHNCSLVSVSLDHCSVNNEGQRHIVAGIVSNSQLRLRELRGFNIGPIIVTLGFPPVMEHWSNEHLMNFIHLMWERAETPERRSSVDPLHFLPVANGNSQPSEPRPAPLDAAAVVEIAKKTFQSLVEEGVDVFSRRPDHPGAELAPTCSLSTDGTTDLDAFFRQDSIDGQSVSSLEHLPIRQSQSFVAPPEEAAKALPDPSRKKRIVEWLCSNIQHLNKLAQKPFSSAELWQLHQHYFTPVVNECGGSVAPSPNPSADLMAITVCSVPEVSRTDSSENPADGFSEDMDDSLPGVPASDPSMKASPIAIASLPMLKRKVSYRFLGDATLASAPRLEVRNYSMIQQPTVSMMIEGGPAGQSSLPPKTKRARRNRTRISFLPRVKAKLDSFLDVCHEKALVTMRQLYYVEQAILKGQVNPIDPKTTSRTHLCGDFATDAEIIIVDMI